ncbi:MAG TPA: serine/threonine protein kinase, partial [Polyangiaceae bacterium]|nr:serine/threonine protein kinase [Polyangiaceae bacterium]
MGILTQHMYKAPVPIRALVPAPQEVPPGLEAVVLKCLSKRPEHRYQSMSELIDEFDKLNAGAVPDAVPEMMARSGGFNVPVDYFKKGQMPAPVPATPSSRSGAEKSRWPLYAGIAGVLAAIAIVVGIFGSSHSSSATPSATGSALAAPEPAPKPADSPAAAAPSISPSAAALAAANDVVLSKEVVLATEPIDAHIFRDGADLGQSPVAISVDEGKTVELEIRRDGYKPDSITLDGSKTREVVKLDKLARGAVAPPRPVKTKTDTPPARKPKPGIGGSEIVNPWGN